MYQPFHCSYRTRGSGGGGGNVFQNVQGLGGEELLIRGHS